MRKFTNEELTQDEVVALMKAALMAPTSKRSNSWQFVVVDDKDTLRKLSQCKAQAAQFIADAALAVVVTADPLASDVWIEDAVDRGRFRRFHLFAIASRRFGIGQLLGTGARAHGSFGYPCRRLCARGVGHSSATASAQYHSHRSQGHGA